MTGNACSFTSKPVHFSMDLTICARIANRTHVSKDMQVEFTNLYFGRDC